MNWEIVIGLEVHVRLKTESKLFCACSAKFGDPANTNICPTCAGLPGSLPTLNSLAVQRAATIAAALGSALQARSEFARKSYFYPDLPKGYQITQYEHPLAVGGELVVHEGGREVRFVLQRVHLEEDAGKLIHNRKDGVTLIDLNRAGVPLAEIVTEPTVSGPGEARLFLNGLKRTLQYLEVSDCNMEDGSLRVDANVSVRRPGAGLGIKQELKNLNSLSGIETSLGVLVESQIATLESGEPVLQRTFAASDGYVTPMRQKEEGADYRYFPEPDLLPLEVTPQRARSITDSLPELPEARRTRFVTEFALTPSEAEVLTSGRDVADFFESVAVATRGTDAHQAAGWVINETLALWSGAEAPFSSSFLAEVIGLVNNKALSRQAAKKVLLEMARSPTSEGVAELVARMGVGLEADASQMEQWVEAVLAEYADEAARLRAGEGRLMDFLMGRVMAASRGTADPHVARQLISEKL